MDYFIPKIRSVKKGDNFYSLDLFYEENITDLTPKITFETSDNKIVKDIDSLNMSGSELIKLSFSNLSKIQLKLSDGKVTNEDYLMFEQKHASDKILDKSFIKELENELNSDEMIISIPAQDTLLICSENNPEAKEKLILQTQLLFNDFSKEAISQLIFKIKDGKITSAYKPKYSLVKEDAGINIGTYKEDLTKVKLFQNLYNFRILAMAENIEDLQNGLFQSVLKLLRQIENQVDFNNKIEIITGSCPLVDNRINIEKIKS